MSSVHYSPTRSFHLGWPRSQHRGYLGWHGAGILDHDTIATLDAIAEPLNPAEITRIQQQLIASAKARTQAGRTAA